MEKIIKKLEGIRVLFFLGAFLFIFLGLGIYFGCQAEILAKNYYYQSIQVDVQVNPDSTFDVKEKQTYNLEGDFGFFYREIELKNLDHISDVQVYDSQENRLNENEYKVSYEGNRLRIQWDFPRRTFDKELKSWTVKYKVHGGLGFFDKWDDIWIKKSLVNLYSQKPQHIDKFLTKNEGKEELKYRFWEAKYKRMTYISIIFPTEYSSHKKIFLKDILSEKDGIKFSVIFMDNIMRTQIEEIN